MCIPQQEKPPLKSILFFPRRGLTAEAGYFVNGKTSSFHAAHIGVENRGTGKSGKFPYGNFPDIRPLLMLWAGDT